MYDLYWSLCKPIMCPITRLHRLQSLPPQPAFDLKKWHNALERDKQSKAWGLNQPCGWLDGAQSKAKANSRLWRVFEIGNYVIKALKHQWSICPSVTCAPCKLVTCCGPVFFFFLRLPSLIGVFFPEIYDATKIPQKATFASNKGKPIKLAV